MAPRTSKKTQADLISLMKSAGWKEDQKTSKEWRWFDPKIPGIYYTLRRRRPGAAANGWRGEGGPLRTPIVSVIAMFLQQSRGKTRGLPGLRSPR